MNLFIKSNDGRYIPALIEEVIREAKTYQIAEQEVMSSPMAIAPTLAKKIGKKKIEHFVAVFLDNANHIIGFKTMNKGIENQAAVYPKEVARVALAKRASAVIVSHNHPGGVLTPSLADKSITKAIKDCLEVFQIRFLDHIIVGNDGGLRYFSFQEQGEMP